MAADLKISQLNAAAALTGAELVEVVQDGANVQTTATALAGLAQSTSGTATDGYVLTADGAGGAAWEEPAGLSIADIDDTPVNGETAAPISSNWAFDHAANLNAHGISDFGETLVDDANAATARGTLGLGDSATKNTGTTAGTVAAGDDSRITGAATAANLTTETDNRVLYDEELTRAVAYATDLAGQAARTLSGSLPNNVPASASSPGVAGQIRYENGYLYVCVASNSWQRVAIATWS